MKGRRNTKRPRNDELILQLLENGGLVVKETMPDTLFDDKGNRAQPQTEIFARNPKSGRYYIPAIEADGFGGAPRIRITVVDSSSAVSSRVRLSVRRVVWLSHNPRATSDMVCPIDGNPANYNIWNLCLRDQNEQNCVRMQNQARPIEDEESPDSQNEGPSWLNDIPF